MTGVYDQILASLPASGRVLPGRYGVLEVSGRDAVEFVHRLCSQDVEGLVEGRSSPTTFLDSKGRVQAIGHLARVGETVLIETQAPQRRPLMELLDRYHFTEQLSLRERDDLVCGEARGTGVLSALGLDGGIGRIEDGDLRLTVSGARRGIGYVRFHGEESAVRAALADLEDLDESAWQALRSLSGEPLVGLDTEERTLALEADLHDHVSTTKGCYTGQEIVARINTYGHVNRRLVTLRLATAVPVEASTPLCLAEDGAPLGRVMTATPWGAEASIAMGYLPETFLEEPDPLVLGAEGGPAVEIVTAGDPAGA